MQKATMISSLHWLPASMPWTEALDAAVADGRVTQPPKLRRLT